MIKKKILLVYPKIPPTYWSMKHAVSLIGKKGLMPPLGLMTIAGFFPRDEYDLILVDMNVRELRDRDIAKADLVMISAMLVQKASFFEVVRSCARMGIPVAAGGPYPTACPEEMEGVDYLVLDEGEVTLPRFIAEWREGAAARVYSDERGAVTPRNLLYLVRSLLLQGFSRYGPEYVRYVFKAIRISPGLIEDLITFAVQGRHFFIITRRFLRGRAAALAAAGALSSAGAIDGRQGMPMPTSQ